jgi:hypothetical protein
MADFKITQIAKKQMKVAVKDVVKNPLSEPEPEPVEQIVSDIQASKPIKLTKKGKPDTRGGNLDNLAKGRAKLQESWDAKRALKEQLSEAALQKKMKLAAKQQKIIEQSFGVEDVATDDEIEEELIQKQIIDTKPLTSKAKASNKVAPPLPPPPPAAKAPKKKVIKYVEQDTDDDEEEQPIPREVPTPVIVEKKKKKVHIKEV